MATEAYVDDIFTIVQALTQAESAAAWVKGLPDTDGSATAYIWVQVGSPELRPALAVQQSLQLSFDAAAIVVAYPPWTGPSIDRDLIQATLGNRLVELTIVHL